MDEARNEGLATVTQAAALLGLSEKTVFRYLKMGLLKRVYVGGRAFVQRSDLKALQAGSNQRRTR